MKSKSFDVILTDPGKAQSDIADTGGTSTHEIITNPADFLNPDAGLSAIGGTYRWMPQSEQSETSPVEDCLESLAGLFGF